jgi:hypothetical protein
MGSQKQGLLTLAVIAMGLLGYCSAITLRLNSNNKKMCFYIRGETVESEFILNYGYSGDGYDLCRTRVESSDQVQKHKRKDKKHLRSKAW